MKVPTDPIGYLVEADGTVHTRYADHATGRRTRTARGVNNLLEGRKLRLCDDYYPVGATTPTGGGVPKEAQKRRTPAPSEETTPPAQ